MTEEIETTPPAEDLEAEYAASQAHVTQAIAMKRRADDGLADAKARAAAMIAGAEDAVTAAEAGVTEALRIRNDIEGKMMGRTERAPRRPRTPKAEGEAPNGRARGRAPRMRRPASPVSAGGQSV